MEIRIHVLATVLFFLCCVVSKGGSSDFPVEFKGIVPEYNNAGVLKKMHTRESTTVVFITDATGRVVLSFYLHALIDHGWVNIDSIWDGRSNMGSIKFKKKNRILFLTVGTKKESEKTKFTIRLEVPGGRE